jgi:8-oxo-dGTP diphosphatase
MNRRVSVRGIVVREGKLLCVRLKPYNGFADGSFWCTPGGGLDSQEGIIAGVRREMIEETGIAPEVGTLLYIQQGVFGGNEHLEFFFHITNAEDYLHIDLSKTTHGEEEIEEIGFIDPATTHILPEFLTTEDIPTKIDAKDSPKIFNFL